MTSPNINRWSDLPDYKRADGINIKWIGCDDNVFDIAGYNAGAQGAIITGPISGMVHVPFKSIWHEPAYGPPRFERTVDERREISTRVMLMSDSEYGWFDTETAWWNGMVGDQVGWWTVFTRRYGELYIPLLLADKVQTDLEVDPTAGGNNSQEWDILLAADGEPRWHTPELRPNEWVVSSADPIKMVKRDSGAFAPNIPVRVGKLKVANRGDVPTYPVFHVSAPGRVWLPDGLTGRMLRVPPLNPGEHVLIDTDPTHRIAISAKDPVTTAAWASNLTNNEDLLKWLGILLGKPGKDNIIERFHGQGFTEPIPARTVATLPIWHTQVGSRVSVRVPQRFERAIS